MPITGSDKAKMVARLGVMRLGASRLGYYQAIVKISVNGVDKSTAGQIHVRELTITDYLNGQPNTATVRASGFTPTVGSDIKIGVGSLDAEQLRFAGRVQTLRQIYEAGNPANVAYDLSCTSYEWLLNRRSVSKKWTNQSASQVAIDLIANHTSGFTYNHVETGLAAVDEFSCTHEDVSDALDRLAKRIGAYWYIDAASDLHFFVTAEGSVHDITNSDDHGAREIVLTRDLTDTKTRILSEGQGSPALVAAAVGQTTLPLESAAFASASGGTVVALQNRITYTGKSAVEGTGTAVAGKPLSPGTLTATVASLASKSVSSITRSGTTASATTSTAHGWSTGFKVTIAGATQNEYNGTVDITVTGSTTFDYQVTGSPATPATGTITAAHGGSGNLSVGAYQYKTTFQTSNGESEVGAASSSVSITDVSTPSAPSGAVTSGQSGNLSVGIYKYKTTYVTASGETLASSASSNVTISDVTAPSAPTATVTSGTSGNLSVGVYTYVVTFVTSKGETGAGTASSNATISAVSTPGALSDAIASGQSGNLQPGAYAYKVTYVTSKGETAAGTASGGETIQQVTPPAGNGMTLTKTTGGSMTSSKTYRYSVTYVTASGETPINGYSETTMGASDTRVDLSVIPTSGDSRVTSRKIYRTIDTAGFNFRLVTTIGDNTTTTFSDTASDASLASAAIPPATNTAGTGKIDLSSIPTSGDGRVTSRKIYRTQANGSTYKLLTTIGDNSTTTFTDNVADGSLGADAPSTDTASSGKIDLSSIPTSADGRVTKRRVYRTEAGGSLYKLLTTINDNSTTTYADNTADVSLGVDVPTVNDAGSGKIDVTIPASGDTRVTRRRIYRTEVGGSEYKQLTTVNDNTTTSFADNVADSSLGAPEPVTGTAGSGQIDLTSVPLGPSGTTARKLYRTEAAGSVFRALATIRDNTTTAFTDNVRDTSLGDEAPTESHVGSSTGDTVLRVKDTSVVDAAGGWVRTDGGQVIRFTGRSTSSGEGNLTGIPASGVGSIAAAIPFDASVINAGFLTGIPSSGAGSIAYAIPQGESVNLLVQADDAAAQAALAALVGGDGIHEEYLQDGRLSSTEALARANAKLTELKDPLVTMTYETRDATTRSGRTVTFSLGAPNNISGTYKIQSVTYTDFDPLNRYFPKCAVIASSRRESFEAWLRILKQQAA